MKIYQNYYPCGLERGVEGTPVKHAIFVQCLNGTVEEAGIGLHRYIDNVYIAFPL